MGKGRLEAFSDGVFAILITILVLELKVPHGESLRDLAPLVPVFLAYVLSFVNLGIYILQSLIIADEGPDSRLARAVGRDVKGKISPALYAVAIPLAMARPLAAVGIYVAVALIWLAPEPRIEKRAAE